MNTQNEQPTKKETPVLKRPRPVSSTKALSGAAKNKSDILLNRLVYDFGCDPLEELVKLAKRASTEDKEKIKIYTELMSYCFPKKKAIETNPNDGEVINVSVIFPEDADTNKKTAVAISKQATSSHPDKKAPELTFSF